MAEEAEEAAKGAADEEGSEIDAAAIAEYLRRHPAFLIEHPDLLPDLLEALTPPARHEGSGVLDLQRVLIERSRGEVARLKSTQGELIAASRSNLATQAQVHAAVLGLLEAESFEHLLHTVTADFAQFLDVDAVTLAIESRVPPRMSQANFYILPKGSIDRLIGRQREVRLRADAEPLRSVFGPAAPLVRSDALVRLTLGERGPAGLLAIGSREAGKFHDGQGTELLLFLARALALRLSPFLAEVTALTADPQPAAP